MMWDLTNIVKQNRALEYKTITEQSQHTHTLTDIAQPIRVLFQPTGSRWKTVGREEDRARERDLSGRHTLLPQGRLVSSAENTQWAENVMNVYHLLGRKTVCVTMSVYVWSPHLTPI